MFERLDSWEIPAPEISALCARNDALRGTEVLAVGDARWAVAVVALGPAGPAPQPATDVEAAIADGGRPTTGPSQFEGVASDGTGRVFVLQEGPSRVLVLDPALAELEHTIKLNVGSDHPELRARWSQRPNARGEGLLLLGEGHMLVAKQRDPVALIEFGPAGDAPLGYGPGSALAADAAFAMGGGRASVVEALAVWSLTPAVHVESINDLAVDGDGRLHFVSSLSRCIGRLDADLVPGDDVVAASSVPLPAVLFEGDDDKAEGLVFSDALGWLVALDLPRSAPNLHQLAFNP